MGIDLATVRYVIHWSLAKSLEGFYQESGRAGRNGLPAISVLYYSKDEASKFSYLIQKQGGSSKKDPRSAKESVARSLDALQAMVNFCVTPCCRRQYILNHFGENIDAKEVCKETCDYCQNPKQVEQRIEGSQVIQDVVNTQTGQPRAKGQRPNSPPKWDGQWSKPHGDGEDDDDDWQDTWTEGDLGITSSPDDIGMFEETPFASSAATLPRDNAGMNTNSILDKYEVCSVEFAYILLWNTKRLILFFLRLCKTMEEREGSRGFVTFKSNRPQTVSIPEHLRSSNLPDPLAHLTNKKTAAKPTATNPRDSDRLKAELLKLQAQREQTALRLREMQKSKSSSIAPPPPPSLALSKKQKTKRYN
jgi:superfamily II DNA/RNA helicase